MSEARCRVRGPRVATAAVALLGLLLTACGSETLDPREGVCVEWTQYERDGESLRPVRVVRLELRADETFRYEWRSTESDDAAWQGFGGRTVSSHMHMDGERRAPYSKWVLLPADPDRALVDGKPFEPEVKRQSARDVQMPGLDLDPDQVFWFIPAVDHQRGTFTRSVVMQGGSAERPLVAPGDA